jgi:multidrug efflux pump subunit AcrA (membrane-fusion protein)
MVRLRSPIALVSCALIVVSGMALVAWNRTGGPSVPTTVVQKGSFVDYLSVRGEIRPVRSVVLTAPSSGADLQILQLATNGAAVAAGDVVIQFDSTVQQRTLEQRRSELKQAASEIEKAESDGRQRVQAVEVELSQARSAAERARLDIARTELVSKVEAEKLALLLANAGLQVNGLQQKVTGERAATAATVAIARQKRAKALSDVADTERIIESLTVRAPSAGAISLLPNMRAGGPMSRSAPEFRRGDRVWFGAAIAELPDLTSVQMTCRLDEADRARVQRDTRVLVKVDALPDRELTAAIREIAMVAKPDFTTFPPVRNFDAIISLNESDPRLRTGMSASARIEMNRMDDVVVVPTSAIFQLDGASVAYVVERGRTVVRPITLLRRGRDETAVASGLREGERIALRDPTAGAAR